MWGTEIDALFFSRLRRHLLLFCVEPFCCCQTDNQVCIPCFRKMVPVGGAVLDVSKTIHRFPCPEFVPQNLLTLCQ